MIIKWDLNTPVSNADTRAWRFLKTGERIARIVDDGDVSLPASSLSGVNVTKPATLILKNVSDVHNGTYQFQFEPKIGDADSSSVTVFVAGKFSVS